MISTLVVIISTVVSSRDINLYNFPKMSCKLTYFNLNALGEPIRMILAYNGIPYEDVRLDRFGKEWIDKKPSKLS